MKIINVLKNKLNTKGRKNMKKLLILILAIVTIMLAGCERQSDKVSYNLSLEADNFNVTRQLTIINTRAMDGNASILYTMTGNFSIEVDYDNDLNVIGEEPNGTYYKHFVHLSQDTTYVVLDLGGTSVDKHKFEINFNPEMIIPVTPVTID
jgi:hypothetical protein